MWKVKRMKTSRLIARALSFVAVSALILNPALSPALATDYLVASANTAQADLLNAWSLTLGISKSLVVDLPRDVKDVLVADPKIANAVVRSSKRAYIIGAAVGQTSIIFFDAEGPQMAAYAVAVTRDLNGIRAANQAEAQQASEPAARLIGGPDKANNLVVNNITVRGRDQVMLKVTVAEVQRSII